MFRRIKLTFLVIALGVAWAATAQEDVAPTPDPAVTPEESPEAAADAAAAAAAEAAGEILQDASGSAEARDADDGVLDEAFDDESLDEQTYEDDDDDFVPSEEIPADEPIPFPSNI